MNKFNQLFLTVWKYTLAALIFADLLIEVNQIGVVATAIVGVLVIAVTLGVIGNEVINKRKSRVKISKKRTFRYARARLCK